MRSLAKRVLTISDDRSSFPVLSLAWRTDPQHEQETRRLLTQSFGHTDRLVPVWHQFSGDNGSVILTVAAEQPQLERWLRSMAHESSRLDSTLATGPTIALVGTFADAKNFLATATDLFPRNDSETAVLPSRMQQNMVQGYQQTLITGQDPSLKAGEAACFLALCLLSGGSSAMLPRTVSSLGNGATVQISRGLVQRRAAITWQGICRGSGGLQVFEMLAQALPAQLKAMNDAEVQQLKHFALANLSRAWRSPVELAQTANQYQIMDWGQSLISSPQSELDRVTREDLDHAMDQLLRPVLEVLGRS